MLFPKLKCNCRMHSGAKFNPKTENPQTSCESSLVMSVLPRSKSYGLLFGTDIMG